MIRFSNLAPFLLLLLTAACGASPDGSIGESQAAIVSGVNQNSQALAVGLLDDGGPVCSATLMGDDLALTFKSCSDRGTLSLGSASSRVRIRRNPFGGPSEIVALQTSRPVGSRGYSRGIDRVPLQIGDVVSCVGYDDFSAPQLRAGNFEVTDGSSGTQYYLTPRGFYSEVSFLDLGGYCSRDGSTEIAAILTGESVRGVPRATPTYGLVDSLNDIRRAATDARSGAAVRFRATSAARTEFLTDKLMLPPGVGMEPLGTPDTHQAFYLERVASPPGGGTDWYRLVIARDGRCLSEDSRRPFMTSGSCRNRPEEVFYVESLGSLQYRLHTPSGCVDQAPAPPVAAGYASVARCSTAQSQIWEMWLTRY